MPIWIFSNIKKFAICFFVFIVSTLSAQHSFTCIIKDSASHESLPGVNVVLAGTTNGTSSNENGKAILNAIPEGQQTLNFSFTGYRTIHQQFSFPLADPTKAVTIYLAPANEHLEEIVVSSTRTNSRIDDLNTKVEVLGQEDMDEESSVVPGSIGSILGDLSIITIQRTNPVNGNDAIRMQGLDPRYTQIMRDGLPLYGGFSGSLGVLSIPPLDLKQVEIIKGSASTLYGGGAIGGLINFISKAPTDSAQTILTLNASSLKEYNVNAFTSKKHDKLGLTLFAGVNAKTAMDVNDDGFAEVPESKNLSLHPRIFYDFNNRTALILGLTTAYDTRAGGDIQAIRHNADLLHPFLQKEKTFRNTVDAELTSQLTDKQFLTFKTAGNYFERGIDYSGFLFNGTQLSSYSELNDLIRLKKHSLVLGGNMITESFRKNKSDNVLFSNYDYTTLGAFVQDDWQLSDKFSVQGGIRVDHHSRYGNFLLPRLSVFYKATTHLSIRLAAGTGYKVPNLFDLANPAADLANVPANIKAEKSHGSNADISYRFFAGDISVQLDEAFYYTHIDHPLLVRQNTMGQTELQNAVYYINSYGTDTYIRGTYKEVELYIGYNHTESLQETDNTYVYTPFNPKDKFSTTLAYTIESKWRMGIESSWTGNQYIYVNKKVINFWFVAAMVERKFKYGSIVLNCENLLDTRQSQFEKIVTGTTQNPVFKPVWAPLEGRSVNLCLKLTL